MTLLKNKEETVFTLVLTREQAMTLGSLRYAHVTHESPLYEILKGLPHRQGSSFDSVFVGGKAVFGRASEKISFAGSANEISRVDPPSTIPDLLSFLSDLYATVPCPTTVETDPANVVVVQSRNSPPVDKWIVQFNNRGPGQDPYWVNLEHMTYFPKKMGSGEFTSRNGAYRAMRKRSSVVNMPPDRYRVVPSWTEGGPEKDRGYYTVQYWNRSSKAWVETVGGPGLSNNSRGGRYYAVNFAEDDIRKVLIYAAARGIKADTYRVKWHPNNP